MINLTKRNRLTGVDATVFNSPTGGATALTEGLFNSRQARLMQSADNAAFIPKWSLTWPDDLTGEDLQQPGAFSRDGQLSSLSPVGGRGLPLLFAHDFAEQ